MESRIFDERGQVLNEARLPYIRTGPIYQLLEADQAKGQIEVTVSAIHQTKSATVSILVYQLPQGDSAARLLEQAYRHYSNGIQSTDSEDVDLWRNRVDELQQAAKLFRKTGLQEQALWSEWLSAYFTYFPVSEFKQAFSLANQVQAKARQEGLPQLELMAKQLEGQAMIERHPADSPELAKSKLEKALDVFAEVAESAERQGMHFERAWAINNQGITYYYLGLLDEALEQYGQVLPIALELQDDYLADLVRGNIAMVNESLGDHTAALDALLAIREDLAQSGQPADRALNLADVGRLYSKLFLFPQAIDALSEAMDISRELDSNENIGRIGLSLATAYYDMGQRVRARDILLTAIDDLKAVNYGRGLRDAYRLLADMGRLRGDHDQVALYREQERQCLRSDNERAGFLLSQGLDALAAGDEDQAGKYLKASHDIAVESDYTGLQIRSSLQLCALKPDLALDNEICDSQHLEAMLTDWLPNAAPRYALDARFSWAQLLIGLGEDARALVVLEQLVADMRTYRSRLPGVLGAWYWDRREKVFSTYTDLVLKHVKTPQQAMAALTKFDRICNLENSGRQVNSGGVSESDFDTNKVRGLMARMSVSKIESERQDLGREIDQLLLKNGKFSEYDSTSEDLPTPSATPLPPNTAYLTYYFSTSDVWAWLVTGQGAQLLRLGEAKPVLDLLRSVREGFRVVGNDHLTADLDRLGSLLLQPLGTTLPETILLGPSGPLNGFPFESLRLGGRFLAQDHGVTNLLSLRHLNEVAGSGARIEHWDSVLIGGATEQMASNSDVLSGAASEIGNLTQLFEQKKVRSVARKTLLRTEFFGPEYNNADLIHIASHASINLDYPELSRLHVSGKSNPGGTDYLTPLDIRRQPTRANLVVLSACETTGLNEFPYDSNLGFVSEFLQAGAGAVIASLWPVADSYTRDFMLEFYSNLLGGEDISVALALTKRKRLNAVNALADQALGIQAWAAFQVYVE